MFKKMYFYEVKEFENVEDPNSEITQMACGVLKTRKLDYNKFMQDVCDTFELDISRTILTKLNKL